MNLISGETEDAGLARSVDNFRPLGVHKTMPTWEVRFDLYVDLTDPDLLRCVYEAEALSKVTQGIPLKPNVRERLNRLNITRAVRGTTGIEGSDLSEAEVAAVLEAPANKRVLPPARAREELEVRNARAVMDIVARVLDADPGRKLSEELVRELHRVTTEGIPYENNSPGQYRSHAVVAGEYVPPRDGDEVRRLMRGFIEWVNSPSVERWPAVVRAVAAHFYFISIHPFGDGNGRSIESFLLYQAQVNQLGFYSLSNFYYRNRPEYIAMLDHVRFQSGGNLTPFVLFAARGLLGELDLISKEVLFENKKVAFHDFALELISDDRSLHAGTRVRLAAVMEHLIGSGNVLEEAIKTRRHPLAIAYAKLSSRTFARDIGWLVKAELVRRRNRMLEPNFEVMDHFTGPRRS